MLLNILQGTAQSPRPPSQKIIQPKMSTVRRMRKCIGLKPVVPFKSDSQAKLVTKAGTVQADLDQSPRVYLCCQGKHVISLLRIISAFVLSAKQMLIQSGGLALPQERAQSAEGISYIQ